MAQMKETELQEHVGREIPLPTHDETDDILQLLEQEIAARDEEEGMFGEASTRPYPTRVF